MHITVVPPLQLVYCLLRHPWGINLPCSPQTHGWLRLPRFSHVSGTANKPGLTLSLHQLAHENRTSVLQTADISQGYTTHLDQRFGCLPMTFTGLLRHIRLKLFWIPSVRLKFPATNCFKNYNVIWQYGGWVYKTQLFPSDKNNFNGLLDHAPLWILNVA